MLLTAGWKRVVWWVSAVEHTHTVPNALSVCTILISTLAVVGNTNHQNG